MLVGIEFRMVYGDVSLQGRVDARTRAMKGWLQPGAAGTRRLLVARLAWLVLYPLTLGLLFASMPSRFTELTTSDAGVGSILQPAGGSYGLALFTLEVLVLILYVTNTLLMASRRSDDWVALYTSIGGLLLLVFLFPASEALMAADPRWTGAVVSAQWLGAAMPIPFLLFFPDGRFVPRRSAILAFIWPIFWAASAILVAGGSGLLTLPALRLVVWLTLSTAGLTAQIHRWKVAGPIQRQQTKWLLASNWALFVGVQYVLPARFLADADLPALLRPEVALPVLLVSVACFGTAFTMAILRSHLWDIDIVVRRTVVYGIVSATLIATYVLAVMLIQAVLRPFTSSSELAVAGSTLLVVALFQPLRRRVQDAVDRRFYRSHYNTARTLEAFSARLRDDVDLNSVRADLLDFARDTLRPVHASLWLREVRRGDGRSGIVTG